VPERRAGADAGTAGARYRTNRFRPLDHNMAAPPIEVFDPHFHIWDIRDGEGYADKTTLFAPAGTDHEGLYDAADLERDWASLPKGFVHAGGVFLEAMSCCFKDKSAPELAPLCLKEAAWVQEELDKSPGKREYYLAPTACLEDPDVGKVLSVFAKNPKIKGIRQTLNVAPDWPRTGDNGLGELLDNPQWEAGYAKLAGVGFSFDMQLNPHQYQKGAAIAAKYPGIPVIINHLGTPTLKDLEEDEGKVFWEGMEALAAAGPHVYLQISMLCYTDPKWDDNATLAAAVARLIKLFGSDRCFFASNYPVDMLPDQGLWTRTRSHPHAGFHARTLRCTHTRSCSSHFAFWESAWF
jgi:predicted TIM-barrel fold metal-dependent hydrolase